MIDMVYRMSMARGSWKKDLFTCYRTNVAKLIISTNDDLFIKSARKFISIKRCDFRIFEYRNLPQNYFSLMNLKEAQETVRMIAERISK
jgi:hypothetical protein